jgi:hypothetical protein
MPELALDDVERHVPANREASVRARGAADLGVGATPCAPPPDHVRAGGASGYLSLEWLEQGSRSVREPREAIAQAAREAEAGPRRQGRWRREPGSPEEQPRDRSADEATPIASTPRRV